MLILSEHDDFKYFKVLDSNGIEFKKVCGIDSDKKFCIIYSDLDEEGHLKSFRTQRLYKDFVIKDTREPNV